MAELLYILHKFIGHKSSLRLNSLEKNDETKVEKANEVKLNITKKEPELKEIISEKVLIAKQFPLSNKILSTLMSSIGVEFDVLENNSSLLNKIDTKEYDIVFTDEIYLNSEVLSAIGINNMNIVLTDEPKDKTKFANISIDTIKQLTSKEEIASIINKFRNN